MAQAFEGGPVLDWTFEAGADLSTKQYHAVKFDGSGKVVLAGAGENAIGVLQDQPAASGRACRVRVFGITRFVAGGVIAPGANVAADANGQGKTAVANTVDTQAGAAADPLLGSYVLGRAFNTANTAQNDIFPLFVNQMGAVPGTVS